MNRNVKTPNNRFISESALRYSANIAQYTLIIHISTDKILLAINASLFYLEFQPPAPEEATDRQLLLADCNAFAQEVRELQCPEFCFKFPFNPFQHPRYSENIHKLSIAIDALGRSIGGVVILCMEPGRSDYVKPGCFFEFKKRLQAWILSRNPSRRSDMLHFVHLPDDKTAWGLVLVQASPSADLSCPHSTDEFGFIVCRDSTTAVSPNEVLSTMHKSNDHRAATSAAQNSETVGAAASTTLEAAPSMKDVDIERQLGKKISWTANKRNWQQHVVLDDDSTFESNVRNYATSADIFIPSDPIVFSPRHMLETLLSEQSDRNRLLEAIKDKLDSPRAFAIVSPSWLSNIGREEVTKRPKDHIGDILLITIKGSVYLWTIVENIDTDDTLPRVYMMIAGRLTKYLLLKDQKEKCALRVDCYLYNLQANTVEEPQFQQHIKSFFVTDVELKHIQETLAETIVARETYLRNIIGEACGYKLSAEQWRIAEHGTGAPVMVVSGPPGSGKTLLCAHFMQEKGKKAECTYVCTNKALADFMKSQNIGSVHVIQTETDLRRKIEHGEFSNKTCIIFDDAHRLSCSDQTVEQLLDLTKYTRNVRLYVFCDNKFQCFEETRKPFPGAVERCCNSMGIECTTYHLGEIHRNTRRIMSFLSAVSFKREIKCLHKWEGDDVEVLAAENPLNDSPDNPLIQSILQVLGHKDSAASLLHYAAHDIAVLIDTDSPGQDITQFKNILREYIRDVDMHSAATYPRRGIVVDCLDSFHGLDAGVCFYILSSTRMKKRNYLYRNIRRGIYNPKYLAFLASRAIHKAVFLVPKLDTKVFKELLFDCFDEKVIQVVLCFFFF